MTASSGDRALRARSEAEDRAAEARARRRELALDCLVGACAAFSLLCLVGSVANLIRTLGAP